MIRDILKALVLGHALPVIGILFSVGVLAWGGYEWRVRSARVDGFHAGYAQARDSVAIKAQREKRDSAVAHAQALHDSAARYTAVIDSERSAFHAVPRHTPRIEPLPLADSLARIPDPVLVTVASTGEHFVLPRAAARYWYVSDSLVAVAAKLLDKYAAANKQWSEAWQDEHSARLAGDSIVVLLRQRSLASVPVQSNGSRLRQIATAVGWLGVGFIAAKHVHIKL